MAEQFGIKIFGFDTLYKKNMVQKNEQFGIKIFGFDSWYKKYGNEVRFGLG